MVGHSYKMELEQSLDVKIAVMESKLEEITKDIKEMRDESKEQHEALFARIDRLDKRINLIERWRWMLIGAAVVIGYFLADSTLLKLFTG
jgi:hypothetical protein